jgi:hypothetical protein
MGGSDPWDEPVMEEKGGDYPRLEAVVIPYIFLSTAGL